MENHQNIKIKTEEDDPSFRYFIDKQRPSVSVGVKKKTTFENHNEKSL